jgi:uncharacterized protein YndB with AHSA1/START domain
MATGFTVQGRISKPVDEVFEAVADPARLSNYFTTGGAKGRLEAGATVTWDFHDFPGEFPVFVTGVETGRRITLQWNSTAALVEPDEQGNLRTTVTFEFEPIEDGRTLVRISESGWNDTQEALQAS